MPRWWAAPAKLNLYLHVTGRPADGYHPLASLLAFRDIAERLFVSEATVKTHGQRILRKLDADSRTHAVSRAHELMLL